jgi:hypothetical protein
MTTNEGLATLSDIQTRIFALFDKVTYATRVEAYAAMMRAQREVVFTERIKAMQTIESRLAAKARRS